MRVPGWLWEVRALSSSPSLACLPLSLPPSLPSLLPPLLLLSPPSLDVGCRLEPGGTGRGTARPRGRRGCAEGGCPAAGWRAPGRGGGAAGGSGGPQPPTPRQVGGRGPRRGEGRRAGPTACTVPGGRRALRAAWRGASGSQALPARGPGSVMCYFCLLALHEGFAPQSLPLLFSTGLDLFLPLLVGSLK